MSDIVVITISVILTLTSFVLLGLLLWWISRGKNMEQEEKISELDHLSSYSKILENRRLDPDYIASLIVKEEYQRMGKQMICLLTLRNGFEAIGSAGVVNREEFDEEIGKASSYLQALDQVYLVEAYRLHQNLHELDLHRKAFSNVKSDQK